ncbi:serine/arginine repetitive matrix protein 2-like isoform X2 [Sceloporus undulatus]|uniref:serine/arginine repetitive matrix protein 2-like isoform X2 n=1 Tax=Sceloporus undulatus TaxID=8520 RepID=UPI001C4D69E9|nr:serine/arginine repetitive matrix protein 2-like isoform X2 [Sceloporus undulatus]XP_042318977.1 serine/arginine repetitive matrix protein 2-like isoform X2 [Sceloporus undulatus]
MDTGFLRLTCQTETSREVAGICHRTTVSQTCQVQDGASLIPGNRGHMMTTWATTEVHTEAVVDVPKDISMKNITIVAIRIEDLKAASQKPNKTNDSEKMKTEQGKGDSASSSKETEQGKGDSASSEKKTDLPKVNQTTTKAILSPTEFSFRLTESSAYPQNNKEVPSEKKEDSKLAQLENSQTADVYPKQTSPILSAKTPTEEEASFNITKDPHGMEKEPTVMKDKSSDVVEDSANETHLVPSFGAPVEEQTSETTEDTHPSAKENSPLLEVRESADHFEHDSAHLDVKIPFLCETTKDHPSEEKDATELTSSTDSCVSHERKDTAVTVDACSLPHTLSDICCVPVLVRETKTKLPFPWEINSLLDEPVRGWAPEDCQEPPWSVNEVHKSEKVSECDRGSVPSQSLPQGHVSCDQKCHIERLQYCHSCSTKSYHSSTSKDSSQNCAPRELFIQRSRSPHSQERKSRSPHSRKQKSRSPHSRKQKSRSPPSRKQKSRSPPSRKQKSRSPPSRKQKSRSPPSREQKSRSPHSREQKSRSPPSREQKSRSPPSREQKSRSPHRQKKRSGSPQQQEQESSSPHRQEESLHRQEQSLRSPHRKKQRLKSSHRQEQSSKLYYKRKWPFHERERSSGFPQRRRIDFGRHYYPYCNCKHSCSLPQDNFWEEELSPHYLPCKIKCSCSPKERSTTGKPCPPASNAMRTKKKKVKKVKQPEETAKKRTSSEEGKESVKMQMAAKSEETGSPCLPNIEEKTTSWTLKDRSAAVLARTEEIEKAYLRVLLNFAGVAVMLVEKEPSVEAAIESALRANLRRIGDYYEHMLKNYIDSLAEAS